MSWWGSPAPTTTSSFPWRSPSTARSWARASAAAKKGRAGRRPLCHREPFPGQSVKRRNDAAVRPRRFYDIALLFQQTESSLCDDCLFYRRLQENRLCIIIAVHGGNTRIFTLILFVDTVDRHKFINRNRVIAGRRYQASSRHSIGILLTGNAHMRPVTPIIPIVTSKCKSLTTKP